MTAETTRAIDSTSDPMSHLTSDPTSDETADETADPVRGPASRRSQQQQQSRRHRLFVVAGLFVCFVLAGFVSGFASGSPDGLEKVAADEGFLDAADDHPFANLPLANYAVEGIDNERLAGGVAGVIGVTITFLVGGALVFGVVRLRAATKPTGSSPTG